MSMAKICAPWAISSPASSAAEGISTMQPIGGRRSTSTPRLCSSSRQAVTSCRQASQSAAPAIMGKRIRRSPQGAACSSARICGHSRRWFCRPSLTVAVQGASSSALESQVRTASMAPLAASRCSFSRFNCSCSDSSFKITDSVRSRPVPTAVNGRALSSVPYRFVIVSRRNAVPSLVRQGWAATGSATLPCRRFSAILQSAWAICAPSGSTIRLPVPSSRLASRMARLPAASAATPSPNCSTAGRPMLRAMIAAWLMVLSWLLASPRIMRRSRLNRSLGKKRSATKMLGRFKCRRRRGRPSRISTTRRQTSQTSTLRSRMYSSSTSRRRRAKICSARSTAAAPPAPAAM